MALIGYLAFLGAACAATLRNWRTGWLAVIVCGVVQDPVRKLTPGNPVAVSFLVVFLFAFVMLTARRELVGGVRDVVKRFPAVCTALITFLFALMIAAANGMLTYGLKNWKVPVVSLATYVAPLTAILLGYVWFQREEMLYRFLRVYAVLTSLALVGSVLEYWRVSLPIIGAVSLTGDSIRHLPGIQIRMLSGFYRSPDIMALHAAMLTAIGIAMVLRAGIRKELLFWYGVAGFGFLTSVLAGRRKALYFVAVFCAAFLWRFLQRLKMSQVFAIAGVALILVLVMRNISANEATSVYARGAVATQQEFLQRLEGGAMETFRQFGLMGAGLGTATQGVRHLLGTDLNIGWQEGGMSKLAIEVGLPGMLAVAALLWVVFRLWMRLTSRRDVTGSSQFVRVLLFAFAVANGASYLASAQAYSDAVLALMAGFLVGCLFATATLDERLAAVQRLAPSTTTPLPSSLPPSSLPVTS